jgi:hypothetical protein
VARGDVELGEELAKVVDDRVLADEQPLADGGVQEAFASEARDLGLLGGKVLAGLDAAFADVLVGRQQLARGARDERLGAHADEHLVRGAQQLLPGVQPAAFAPEPFAVRQAGTGGLECAAAAAAATPSASAKSVT